MAQRGSASEVKLPLMCKARHLAPLPLAPVGSRFAVCWGAGIYAPEGSLGYLVSFTGKRSGQVVAWLRDGGYVYACDGYLHAVPAEEPVLRLALWESKRDAGCVRVRAADGSLRQMSEFTRSAAGYTFVDAACDLGASYTGTPVDFVTFLAIAYLAFYHLPQMAGLSGDIGRTMGDVLDELLELPPADAIDALVGDVARSARTSGFERYAARTLADADPAAFRRLTAEHDVSLRRLGTTGLFWMACDIGRFSDEEASCCIAVEGALNRLALIARAAHENGFDALLAASEARCADEDWRIQRSITQQGARLLAAVGDDNPFATLRGTTGKRGGEWDLRTRVAALIEHLVLPYRLVYRFAVNAQEGTATVVCWVPPASAMPQWCRGAADELDSCSAYAPRAACAYALRLATLLLAALFGAGSGVLHAQVRLTSDRALTRPVLVADLDRTGFVTAVHPRLSEDAFSHPDLSGDIDGLRGLMAPTRVQLAEDGEQGCAPLTGSDAAPFDPEPVRSLPIERDTRRLPPDLAALLHADTVAELDVFHLGEDPFADRLQAAADRVHTDQRAAAQQLSDLLGVMDVIADIGAGDDGRRPLYCSNNIARFTMALIDDDPASRYRYVPDSAFEARVLLARLCSDNDDAQHGVLYAQQAVELGPTSARGLVELAAALLEMGDAPGAATVLKQALGLDALPSSYTYLYYRLAFALWRAGDAEAAMACYVRALPHPTMHDAALEELRMVMAELRRTKMPTEQEVETLLARAGVPDAPVDAVVNLAARVLVLACDAGLLNLAALYAQVVGVAVANDVVSAALMSLAPWGAGS